jgi:hypothetical protein
MSDYWIVGRRFDQRELYALISKRDATLPEIDEEIRRMRNLQLNSIFLE